VMLNGMNTWFTWCQNVLVNLLGQCPVSHIKAFSSS
jgi:hypothetical protein